jgi:hypothetical protein
MNKNVRKGKIVKRAWPFLLAALILVMSRIALHFPGVTEKVYSENIYPLISEVLSSFSRLFPFSLWDIFWAVMILLLIVSIAGVVIRKISFRMFLLRLGQILALMLAYFYLSWGFNYFRPALNERIGFEIKEVNDTLFRITLDSVISNVNRNYFSIRYEDYNEIDSCVERSYSLNASLTDITYPNGYRRPKKMIFSNLIAKFGISGYFGPFFNEINLNRKILPMEYTFLLAHEKAHQFGVAGEADANMTAFLVCSQSESQKLRYSGYFCLLLYFLEDAQYLDDYGSFLEKLDSNVIEELRYRQQYYYGLQNETMEKAQEKVYDAYLKGNNVSQGIENYNQVVELVISWFGHASVNR